MWKSPPAPQWPPWTLSLANCSYSYIEETRNAKKFEFTTNNIGSIGIYIIGIFRLLRTISRLLKIEMSNLSWLYLGRWPENSPIPSTRRICSKWNSELSRSHACARNATDTPTSCSQLSCVCFTCFRSSRVTPLFCNWVQDLSIMSASSLSQAFVITNNPILGILPPGIFLIPVWFGIPCCDRMPHSFNILTLNIANGSCVSFPLLSF